MKGALQPVLGTSHRGPARVALDLWWAGGSFRGFTEFALIGAVVLAFLPGGAHLNFGGARQSSASGAAAAKTPETPRTIEFATPLAPRISDVAFGPSYFDDVPEPLRSRLRAALSAYRARDTAKADQALVRADPAHAKVLLLRGLNTLQIGNRESLNAGIGYLEGAVAQSEPRAMALLGVIKVAGTPGYPRDVSGGRSLLERAAAAGDAAAARVMGEGFLSGWMGMVDPARARHYLQLASDRHDTLATFRLGEMLSTGHGVAKDDAEAERLFVKAADAGHVEALAMLGARRLIQFGSGLTDNPDDALRWLELAAAQNEPHAMYYLGMFYAEYGKRIGRLDLARAIDLFRRCAETTLDVQCLFAYATGLDLGLGTTRDPVHAYAMYVLSAANDKAQKAQARRDELARTLSSEEMVRANVIATQMVQNSASGKAATWEGVKLVPMTDRHVEAPSRQVQPSGLK
jgi:TPR repeat protein